MLRKALITALIIGTSSVAFAEHETQLVPPPAAPMPAPGDDHKTVYDPNSGDYVVLHSQDHSQDNVRDHRMFDRRPVLLADNVSITNYYRDQRGQRPLFISIDSRMGGFSKLRFDRSSGRTRIDSVIVMLPNGTSRTYHVNQTLSWWSPSFTIDLDTRGISGIYVYGSSMRGWGTFDVTGMRNGFRRWGHDYDDYDR